MQDRVLEIIKESLNVEDDVNLTPETDIIMELDGDSLDVIEIVIDIEEEFDISIAEENLEGVRYIKDLLELIQEQIDAK